MGWRFGCGCHGHRCCEKRLRLASFSSFVVDNGTVFDLFDSSTHGLVNLYDAMAGKEGAKGMERNEGDTRRHFGRRNT